MELSVPLMTPVDELMLTPLGRLVALYVSVSPAFGSVASASRLTTLPSLFVWSVMSVLKTGAWLAGGAAEWRAGDPQWAVDGRAVDAAGDGVADGRAGAFVHAVAGDQTGAAGQLLVRAARISAAVRATFQMRTSSSTPSKKPPVAPVVSSAVPSAAGWVLPVPGAVGHGGGVLLDAVEVDPEGRAVVRSGGVIPGPGDQGGRAHEPVVDVVSGGLEVGRDPVGRGVDAEEPVDDLRGATRSALGHERDDGYRPGVAAAGAGGHAGAIAPEPGLDGEGVAVERGLAAPSVTWSLVPSKSSALPLPGSETVQVNGSVSVSVPSETVMTTL